MLFRSVLLGIVSILLISSSLYADVKLNSTSRVGRIFSKSDEVLPGIVVIKFKSEIVVKSNSMTTNSGELNSLLNQSGVISIRKIFNNIQPLTKNEILEGKVDLSRIYYGYINYNLDPREVASRLSSSDKIEYAEPKFLNFIEDVPNDPLISSQNSAFNRMNVFNGWTIVKGDSNVTIATIDGGTYWQHEDLFANIKVDSSEDINGNGRFDFGPPPMGDEDGIDQDGNGFIDDVIGWNFTNSTNNPRGLSSTPSNADHGTNTASNFGAVTNNGIGMAGTSWNCRLMPVNVSSTQDNSIAYGYEGIVYAFTKGASVINCSWGRTGGFSFFEQEIINAAVQSRALVVASAGNGGYNNDLIPHYPSSYKNVLGVGATNFTSDAKASFSNYGRTVPVYGPGINILSATNSGSYSTYMSGTSYSSPLVAGLAGLLKSQNLSWSPKQIAAQIRVTCDSIDAANPSYAGNLGRGRVNFARALTESHPGIEIVNSTILTTQGKSIFLPGDTIVVSLSVQNVLFARANNLTFTATTSDALLQVITGTASTPSLLPGEETNLTPLLFRVGNVTSSKDIVIRLNWVSNTNDRDSYAYKVTVFPSIPFWETQTSPIQTSLYSVKAVDSNIAWAAGSSSSVPVVLTTSDGGINWNNVTGNLSGVDLYCVTALDETRAWVGTGNGEIFATFNGGSTWTQQTYPSPISPFINGIWIFNDGTGYAQGDPLSGNKFVVLKTTDFGQNWSHLSREPVGASGEAGWNNSFWWTSKNYGWFGTNKSKVWRTTDGGSTWTSAPSGAINSYGVSFKDSLNGIVTHSNGVIRVSSNGGESWASAVSPTTSAIVGVAFIRESNSAWVTTGASPYRSTNNGSNWSGQSTYPISGTIYHISFADTSNGWAVTSNGEVLKYKLPTATGVEPNNSYAFPTSYIIEQNYPNPFNPTTIIKYQLPADAHVKLIIYDVLGQEVTTLVNEFKKFGSYEVEFNARLNDLPRRTGRVGQGSKLPSGIYFYQFKVYPVGDGAGSPKGQTFIQTKKAILMK
jgi:subtilisin family serine protease/photosystem II stability/assembly factor-like uncharacterized protein